jgi:ABC-type transport system involved in multi-copper enzyme maturation permease subunit
MLGILRDRALYGILTLAALFAIIPSASSLSMRQVTELSITLSLSLISFVLLLCAVFFSSFSIWRDIERRYSFSVLAMPVSRSHFIIGKFLALALFILLCGLLLGLLSPIAIKIAAATYQPDRPIIWANIFFAISFDVLKYILLCAFGLLFSTLSTSFFLPVFGTISIFLCGTMSQDVKNYLDSSVAVDVPVFVKQLATIFYYIVPNFDAFDFNLAAIYSMPIDRHSLLLTFGYFVVYTAIILFFACFFFNRRELR